jgi:hypothetical protein
LELLVSIGITVENSVPLDGNQTTTILDGADASPTPGITKFHSELLTLQPEILSLRSEITTATVFE